MPAKKAPSKVSTVLSKLNPNTPVKKFLLFIIVFALLGGGYFAYKSFAATQGTVAFSNQMTPSGNARLITERSGSKRNAKVYELSPGASVTADFATGVSRAYRVCTIFKLPLGGIINVGVGLGAKGGSEQISIPAGTKDYQKRCASGSFTAANARGIVSLQNGSDLRVSAISLEPAYSSY